MTKPIINHGKLVGSDTGAVGREQVKTQYNVLATSMGEAIEIVNLSNGAHNATLDLSAQEVVVAGELLAHVTTGLSEARYEILPIPIATITLGQLSGPSTP